MSNSDLKRHVLAILISELGALVSHLALLPSLQFFIFTYISIEEAYSFTPGFGGSRKFENLEGAAGVRASI